MRPIGGLQSLVVMMRGRSSRTIACLSALALAILVLSSCALLQPNRAPTAAFTAIPDEGYESLDVVFDASAAIDPDGDALTYAWTFGDGTTGTGVQATHTYANAGAYDVVLRVTDPEGLDDAAIATVEVLEVPEGSILRRYAWTWDGAGQRLDALLPWSLYQTYRGQLRIPFIDNYDYGAFVDDPRDDPTLEDLADALAALSGSGDLAFAENALAFVQEAIAYEADPPAIEWPLYPLETLVDGTGDCEDTAILYVSLLKARGVSCRLAFVDTDGDGSPDHVLALVAVGRSFVQGSGMTVFELDGTRYAVAETSSGSIDLGVDPWDLEIEDLIDLWPYD